MIRGKETKIEARLRSSENDRHDREGCIGSKGDVSGCQPSTQGDPHEQKEDQMTRPKWYSPQLSREVVSWPYQRSKTEHVPMTLRESNPRID